MIDLLYFAFLIVCLLIAFFIALFSIAFIIANIIEFLETIFNDS